MFNHIFHFFKLTLLFLPISFEKYLAFIFSKISGKNIGVIQWALALRIKKNHVLKSNNYKLLIPPKDRFWADPHVIKDKDKFFIFIEEYSFWNRKGHISVIEINEEGKISKPKKIIEKPYHMSYPFVFKIDSQFYMIPETSQSGRIELYESSNFPTLWKYSKTIMENIEAVDSTLFQKEGKWWLFTSIKDINFKSSESNLHIFHSDNFDSNDWKSHKKNPFISKDYSSRSGGRLFRRNGDLVRPTQDCNGRYGQGIHLNLIKELSDHSFHEERLISSKHLEKSYGLHTVNFYDELQIFDIAKYRHDFFR